MEPKRILRDISWNVSKPPSTAQRFIRRRLEYSPLTERELRQIVIPAHPFTLILPASRFGYNIATLTFDPEGIPVSMEEILNVIYGFYQGPITEQDIAVLRQGKAEGKPDYEYLEGAEKIIDLLGNAVYFEGLYILGDDRYQVVIGS